MADPLHGFFTGKHCPVVIAMRRDLCGAKNAGAGNAPVLAKAVYFFDLVLPKAILGTCRQAAPIAPLRRQALDHRKMQLRRDAHQSVYSLAYSGAFVLLTGAFQHREANGEFI